ncbi:MAG: hypothetical protein NT040_16515 [Bacteroidetes bacterium]|nr:hypothetical protein [Bacteroidota bacterium]
MGFHKKLVILVILSLLPRFLGAQQTISRTSHKVDYRIPYRTSDGKTYVHGNSLLREMAKDVLREPWLVRIRFTCELGLCVVKDSSQYKLQISLGNEAIGGDTVYRHFPVTGVLLPSHISMKLKWANRADTSGFTEEALAGKRVPRGDSLLCTIPIAPFDTLVDTLMVRDVELFYDSLALQSFLDRIELIHDYYAAVSLLDSLQRLTSDLKIDNPGLLPVNYLKVEELNSVISRIDARDFPGRLLNNGFDPSGFLVKYRQVYRNTRSLVYNLMDEVHKTGIIPWDGDADRLAGYFTSRVLSYVSRSFLMDQQQGRIYGDCLDHFFDRDAFPPEEHVALSMLAKMYPDARQDTVARYISTRIYASYRDMAQQLMAQNRYAEAFSMMENGRRFLAANPSMKGISADNRLQSQAAEGICNSFIGIASTCIRSHKYEMAETYLAKADQYATAHAGYISSDSAYRAVFSELFFLRNVDCDQLLDQKKYAEALDCYRQFEDAYSPHDLALVGRQLDEKKSVARMGLGNLSALLSQDALNRKEPDTALFYYKQATLLRKDAKIQEPVDARLDSLAPLMARIRFEQVVREGTMALEKRQFTLSVSRFKDAKILAGKYGIDRSREFDSLYRQAMKNFLIVQLSSSQKKIWGNQFDSAQLALERTETAGFDFGLLNDADFTTAIDHYKTKITEQLCRNLLDSVDLRMIRGDRGIALHNFVKAMLYMREALSFSRSMAVCGIPQQPILDSLAKYADAAVYQQNLADAGSLVASGSYAEAVTTLAGNQQAYQLQKLGRFGIQMADIYDFIRDRNNPYFTERAVSFYLVQGKLPEAVRFLRLAREQDLPAVYCALLQEELGEKLAVQDYAESHEADVIQKVAAYFPADKWYDAFRKSYLGKWNVLVKSQVKENK